MRFILLDRLDFLASPQLKSSLSSQSSTSKKLTERIIFFIGKKIFSPNASFCRRARSDGFSIGLPTPIKNRADFPKNNIGDIFIPADPAKRWNNYCQTLDRLDQLDLTERALNKYCNTILFLLQHEKYIAIYCSEGLDVILQLHAATCAFLGQKWLILTT